MPMPLFLLFFPLHLVVVLLLCVLCHHLLFFMAVWMSECLAVRQATKPKTHSLQIQLNP